MFIKTARRKIGVIISGRGGKEKGGDKEKKVKLNSKREKCGGKQGGTAIF